MAYQQPPQYQPPQQQYQQPPPQVIMATPFGPDPKETHCVNCNNRVMTSTSSDPSTTAYILGFVLCIVGCWPCCLIPCCIDSMKTVKHTCPKCNNFLGQYN